MRKGVTPDDIVVCAFNFTPVPREGYRIGVPIPGEYEEIFNSDSEHYAGANVGNGSGLGADSIPWQERDYSLLITIPPLGATFLRPKIIQADVVDEEVSS